MADAAAELARAIKRDDAKAIIAAATKVLQHDKEDRTALQAKAVALLHDGKHEELLAFVGSRPEFAFHRAYALYRSDRIVDALAVCDSVKTPDDGLSHLKGQLLYRVGRYAESADVYANMLTKLVAEGADDQDVDDVRLNFAAACVAAGRSQEIVSHPEFGKILQAIAKGKASKVGFVFELLYNIACALIDAGDHSNAMRALQAAYVSAEADMLADGVEPSKVVEELAIVRAQAAYLLQQGHFDDAAIALYSNILMSHPSDPSVPIGVASNMAQYRTSGHALVDSYKRLRTLAVSPALSRVPKRQVASVHYNKAVVCFLLRRFEEARAAANDAAALVKEIGSSDKHALALSAQLEVLLAVITATQGASGAETAVGIADALKGVDSKQEGSSAAFYGIPTSTAIRAQLLAADGKHREAADLLIASAKRSGEKVHPAVAACIAQLLVNANATTDALSYLGGLVSSGGVTSDVATLASIMHQRAAIYVHNRQFDAAAAEFEAIAKVPGISNELKGAALSCLAMMRTQQAGTASIGEGRSDTLSSADMTLREATALAVGVGGRKPSFADISRVTEQATAALEWPAVDAKRSDAAATTKESSAPMTTSVGGALPSTAAAPSAEELAAAAKAAARAARRKKKALARRAKRKEAYLAKLRARGDYDIPGIPNPKADPERWLPKRMRTYGSKSRRRMLNKAMNVSSGAAQGTAGSESITRDLDAKARAEAKKTAAVPAPAPAPAAPAIVKRKGGKGRK